MYVEISTSVAKEEKTSILEEVVVRRRDYLSQLSESAAGRCPYNQIIPKKDKCKYQVCLCNMARQILQFKSRRNKRTTYGNRLTATRYLVPGMADTAMYVAGCGWHTADCFPCGAVDPQLAAIADADVP